MSHLNSCQIALLYLLLKDFDYQKFESMNSSTVHRFNITSNILTDKLSDFEIIKAKR